jgi:hypothetical protein
VYTTNCTGFLELSLRNVQLLEEFSNFMEINPITNVQSSNLLELKESTSGGFEFLPAIWDAAVALISPELENRFSGLKRLEESDVMRRHPLVSYLLATRIVEPDIELRTRVVKALAGVFSSEDEEHTSSETVRLHLSNYLSGMRSRQIFALLQVADFDPSAEPVVAALLSYCSFAGTHLSDILLNRQAPLNIRKRAAHFIGRIGFIDALPCLERLESRLNSKKYITDDRLDENEEVSLLPIIKDALGLLRAP